MEVEAVYNLPYLLITVILPALDTDTKFLHKQSTEQVLASSELLTHHPASVSSPRTKGRGYTLAVRGWGSMFRKTPAIGLASYSIIPLRIHISFFFMYSTVVFANEFLALEVGQQPYKVYKGDP